MLILGQALADRIAAAAGAARPLEYCAALLGSFRDDGDVVVLDYLRLRNADGRLGRFAVAVADLFHAERVAAARGLLRVAWLHSHPGGSTALSSADRESLALAGLPWMLAASRDGTVHFAAYAAGTAKPISVVIRP